jgi:hypothetical protein
MPKNRPATTKGFIPDSRVDDVIKSAIAAIKGILALQIMTQHKKTLLSRMIWAITEAPANIRPDFDHRG